MLCDIHAGDWDEELLRLFDIPRCILPEIRPNTHLFGETDPALFGRAIPIAGIAGDQQSALIGQACFSPGMVKSTYGTGCFLLMNTGEAVSSPNRLLTTPAYHIGDRKAFALEGSIFVAGAAIKWLRDKIGILGASHDSERLARAANPDHGVTVVPGFTGLGAPHWRPDARGLISGLTLDTSAADLVRATLEGIALSTRDLTEAMGRSAAALRIDGGMSQNSWFAQYLADILDCPVERPESHETTAWGAALLAGLTTGAIPDLDSAAANWRCGSRFEPAMNVEARKNRITGWQDALQRALA